jgi:diacylglycerol kinase family enzyme
MKLGVLVNASAGRLLRHPETVARLRDVAGSDAVFVTTSQEEVPEALESLRGRGSNTLLVVGGDGTVTGTLTPLLRTWPAEQLPAVALNTGGTINTIAKHLGTKGPPEQVAKHLLGGKAREVRRLALVRIRPDGGEPIDGMLFVNGVGVRWLKMYYTDSRLGVRGASSVIARIAASGLVRGPLARRVFAPFRAELQVDGVRFPPTDYTVMAAGGIREIGLGFKPFHTAGSDPERVHLAVTSASAFRFLREVPELRAGRPMPGSALRHFPVREARFLFESPEPWSMDAEIFPPARELQLGASPPLDFVSVGGRFR